MLEEELVDNLAQLPGLAFVEASVESSEGGFHVAEVPVMLEPQK